MTKTGVGVGDVARAFRHGREAAAQHMRRADEVGFSWHEETVTDLLLTRVGRTVFTRTFSKREEGKNGADWVWWWVDESGTCFGMLSQAKRLKKKPSSRWWIDFGYDKGEQRRKLMRTADGLDVPPMYILYFGTPEYRLPMTCGLRPHPRRCRKCERKTVSILPALMTEPGGIGEDAAVAFDLSVPLEDIPDPRVSLGQLYDLNIPQMIPELRAFFTQPQSGAARVAKLLTAPLSQVRGGQFSLDTAIPARLTDDHAFPDVPGDSGHLGVPYLRHILRGLRTKPPHYVEQLLADPMEEIDVPAMESLDGITVVRV
ncbi:hypothetical protein [Diaminobutyricibacter sp. McL0608]|uniref:hypothetical protein n=1 Tax=Leifsonia sp. McL0608 TaxID=3143537 RepID=UPI0031F302FF